ncbi:type II RES/Xre toxin-antitoxin system antitoxin [Rubritalea sp.]|uniref:type II RES/Xre toxin-antitoxin system antitoxin n=1 Tax=Rubritalea sp. TaxID=2109375 RepID=UPI003EFA4E5C
MKESIVHTFLPKLETHPPVLNESAVAYGSEKTLVERLREGLPMTEFHALQELLKLPEEELGRSLGISPATLHRRKKIGRLETPESERIIRLARLFGLTMEALETPAATREWLKAKNPGTAGESPLTYADTEYGAREVENLLGQIDHGVFS